MLQLTTSAEPEYRQERIDNQRAALEGLAASIDMSIADLAMISFGMRMGKGINAGASLDLSPYPDTTRLLFAKEFSRMMDYGKKNWFDGRRNEEAVPVIGNSLLFGISKFDYEVNEVEGLHVLSRTIRHTTESFIGKNVLAVVGESTLEGVVTKLGGTQNFVDRRDYYAQFYNETTLRPGHAGRLLVREHVAHIGDDMVDLDSVSSFDIAE